MIPPGMVGILRIPPGFLQEYVGECKELEFPRPGTNGTRLQLIRSCAFLLDPDVLISKCQSAKMHQDFLMQRMCAKVRSYIRISNARMIEIKARI